jgi:hypothetical protein
MSHPDRLGELARLRGELAGRLAERVADPVAPLSELRELEDRLRLVDAGLAASRTSQPRRRWPAALYPALAVALLVSVAASLPVQSVPFTLDLQAREVTLQLGAAGELTSQPVDTELRMEGQTRLHSPSVALVAGVAETGAEQLVLRAAQLTLRRVGYPAGSTLVVRSGPQVQLTFEAPRPPLNAEVEFAGRTSWRIGDGPASTDVVFDHAEWVRATTHDDESARRPPPLDLWLGRGAGKIYAWSDLRPTSLQFVQRRGGAGGGVDAVVGSSLEQAHVKLPVTQREVKLGGGDRLEIDGLIVEQFQLAAGDNVAVKLSGTARVLAVRTGDFERSLKPSWLEYMSRHHTVGLFWSAALTLWGAIAWIRKNFEAAA